MTESEENSTESKTQGKVESIKPSVTEECVPNLVWRVFGMEVVTTKELSSYDDKNFQVNVADKYENKYVMELCSHGYVLKILNSLKSRKSTYIEAQHAMMRYLRDRGFVVPVPVRSVEGKDYSLEKISSQKEGRRISCVNLVRLFNFIPGRILHVVPYVPTTLFNIGKFCGQLHQALKNFSHPNYDTCTYITIWSLQQVPRLSELWFVIQDSDDRKCIEDTVAAFKREVIPNYSKLQTGIMHGDLNEQNLLMSEVKGQDHLHKDERVYDVCGLLDFEFSTKSYRIFEIAICIAYISIDTPESWQLDAGGHFLAGYLQYCELNETEIAILKACVCARLSQSLCIGAYTYHLQPGNKYVITTAKKGWPLLRKYLQVSKEDLIQRWKDIMNSYTVK